MFVKVIGQPDIIFNAEILNDSIAPDGSFNVKLTFNNVGTGERIHHHPFELSGGEQQKVALARALAHKPMILFADEPTANLDSEAGDVILNLLKHFNEDYGQTIVMVSHDPNQIKYFDRVIKIRDGLIEEVKKGS